MAERDIAKVAQLLGEPSRAAMMIALLEGKALTAGELAFRANVSAQTASNHLKKLLEAKLIHQEATPTRYRYYRIASPLVAQALEALSLLTDVKTMRPPHHHTLDKDICYARSCYDHLAGTLGVQIAKSLQQKGYLQLQQDTFTLSAAGKKFFKNCAIDCDTFTHDRRPLVKACLDWTEREYHVAGSLGKAFLNYLLSERFLIHAKDKPRVMVPTLAGKAWLRDHLALV